MVRYKIIAAALLAAVPTLAHAQSIQVDRPWARATAPNAMAGGVFMTLTDTGAPDRLIGASTPVAGMAEVHKTVNDNGVMKMLPVDAIDLGTGQKVELRPGSFHIMLMHLTRQLKPGDSFPMTLTFAKSPPVTAMVMVGAAGAMGPEQGMANMPGMATPPKP